MKLYFQNPTDPQYQRFEAEPLRHPVSGRVTVFRIVSPTIASARSQRVFAKVTIRRRYLALEDPDDLKGGST